MLSVSVLVLTVGTRLYKVAADAHTGCFMLGLFLFDLFDFFDVFE